MQDVNKLKQKIAALNKAGKQMQDLVDYLSDCDEKKESQNKIENQNESSDTAFSEIIGKYCVFRTTYSGVHVGILKKLSLKEESALVENSRRIWYWEGAFTLSEISRKGFTGGKISVVVPQILISKVIEIIPVSDEARKAIEAFPVFDPT